MIRARARASATREVSIVMFDCFRACLHDVHLVVCETPRARIHPGVDVRKHGKVIDEANVAEALPRRDESVCLQKATHSFRVSLPVFCQPATVCIISKTDVFREVLAETSGRGVIDAINPPFGLGFRRQFIRRHSASLAVRQLNSRINPGRVRVERFTEVQLAIRDRLDVLCEPENDVGNGAENIHFGVRAAHSCRLPKRDLTTKIPIPKHLIHHRPNPVDVLIPDLHEDRA